jgi:UDP-N-acetylglucosamine 1-carboxyvinyltransferase
MGARISGVGTGTLVVDGVEELSGVEYTVMPDRLDAAVMAMAVGITGGTADLIGARLDDVGIARHKLEQMGIHLTTGAGLIHVERTGPLAPINVVTDTHPGFATDLQSPIAAVATQADGVSYIRERIFDGRFAAMDELAKMGADTNVNGETATIRGRTPLTGTAVTAHDLRTGVALVLAGLAADGQTVIGNGSMIERGHSALAQRLAGLGADIAREVVD